MIPALISLQGCETTGTDSSANGTKTTQSQTVSAQLGAWGVETRYINPQIMPGDDFYRYANDGWLKSATLPPGMPMNGSFVEVLLRTEEQLKTILNEILASSPQAGTPAQQLADMYTSYVSLEQRNAEGIRALQQELDTALTATSRSQIAAQMGKPGFSGIIGNTVDLDAGNPNRYVVQIVQSGIGLPGTEYYLKPEAPYGPILEEYEQYIKNSLQRAGIEKAAQHAKNIIALETRIARAQWPVEKLRDAVSNYHLMSRRELLAYAPGFDWQAYFKAAGYESADQIVVRSNTAIKAIAAIFSETSLDTLRTYTAFHYLNGYAPMLSEPWADAHFELFSRKLRGVQQQRELDKRGLEFVNSTLGELMGRLYSERYFPAKSKAEISKLVNFLLSAMRERLQQNTWMDESTRKAALVKLDQFNTKIGYPDQWHDFSSLQIAPDSLVRNMQQILQWHQKDAIARLKEPVRRWEWAMTPQTINAYYSSVSNEIVFPAAILQPPFFDPAADPAVNFGAIGMVIGHEISHGFDDQGSRFDGTGKLKNWWTDQARSEFESRAQKLVQQFNNFKPLPDAHVNGQLTLGENIGDSGGVSVAWSGWQQYAKTHYGSDVPVLDGFSGDQRFFLGYAQLWRNIMADGYLRQILLTNPHSPGEFRINGNLQNFTPWYDTYHVKKGDALYLNPDQRVRIW